jgi:hypothetical protein
MNIFKDVFSLIMTGSPMVNKIEPEKCRDIKYTIMPDNIEDALSEIEMLREEVNRLCSELEIEGFASYYDALPILIDFVRKCRRSEDEVLSREAGRTLMRWNEARSAKSKS